MSCPMSCLGKRLILFKLIYYYLKCILLGFHSGNLVVKNLLPLQQGTQGLILVGN